MRRPQPKCSTALPRNDRRTLLIGGAAVLGTALLGFGGLLRNLSPGRPAPLVNAAGQSFARSLSERVFVMTNGIRQGLIIQSTDTAYPVRLFLNGGLACPSSVVDVIQIPAFPCRQTF
jgi:hypothetical protein